MKYVSTRDTRDNQLTVTAAEAVLKGLAPDGGLFAPLTVPTVNNQFIKDLIPLSYSGRAKRLLPLFLTDYRRERLNRYIEQAYDTGFYDGRTAPLFRLHNRLFFLELWHGPTAAFKDMALQLLPYLLTGAMARFFPDREVVILTATSGDTGKAALAGFQDVPQTRIVVFYPRDGVSEIQRRQMITQPGRNVSVVAVEGDFDDAQSGVKAIFSDHELDESLKERGYSLTSANSINWGRLVPQIVYYFSAYADLLSEGELEPGRKINIVVPSGNFGNILAAFYATRMGLPVHRLICASNDNNVLTEFIKTGRYSRRHSLKKTISPSMDILISSNLERLLFDVSDHDARWIKAWMRQLETRGEYQIPRRLRSEIQKLFWSDYATEGETLQAIRETYEAYGYLIDPHTAVGKMVYSKYLNQTGDKHQTLIVSTASPFKFSRAVVRAIAGENEIAERTGFELLEILSEITDCEIPTELAGLDSEPVRHRISCLPQKMKEELLSFLT